MRTQISRDKKPDSDTSSGLQECACINEFVTTCNAICKAVSTISAVCTITISNSS